MPTRSRRELEAELHRLFAVPLDDDELERRVNALLAGETGRFLGLLPVWGPPLYRRNRARFRPFILGHWVEPHLPWWRGRYEEALEQWLAEAERSGDNDLFQALYGWKFRTSFWFPRGPWGRDLAARFSAAAGTEERRRVLTNCGHVFWSIDAATARALLAVDAEVAKPYLLSRLDDRAARKLLASPEAGRDEALRRELWRRSATEAEWLAALSAAERIESPEELCRRLEELHPGPGVNTGPGLMRLAERRGPDVLPYLQRHVRSGWFYDQKWWVKLRDLAWRQGWAEVWAAVVICSNQPDELTRAVMAVLSADLGEEEAVRRLRLLGAAGPIGPTFPPLADQPAAALYRRYPDLLRTAFRPRLAPSHLGRAPLLLAALTEAGDDELIDYLASRAINDLPVPAPLVEALSAYYRRLPGGAEALLPRAVRVLGLLPAGSTVGYTFSYIAAANPLAKLLFDAVAGAGERALPYLRDLLESPLEPVCRVGLGLLARGQIDATDHLDLLVPMLLTDMRKTTRRLALGALARAADDEGRARLIHDRARDALDMPDPRYPKEDLIGLVGRLLARHPSLRGPREQPVVYRREGA